MKFKSLNIENFLTIGNSGPLCLDGKGLVLIQGKNLDETSAISNGAGKSSIADALSWVCFGVTAREESGDSIVNRKAKKNCVVTVEILDGDSLYRITRHRKHSTHKNKTFIQLWNPADKSNPPLDLSKGTEAETQKEIERILGCSQEVFMAAIYSGQEKMPDLPRMTDKELKLLIEQGAGIERIEKAYELARASENEAKQALEVASSKITTLETMVLVRAKASLIDNTTKRDDYEAGRPARAESHKNSAAQILVEMQALHAEFKAKNLPGLDAELAKLQGEMNDYRSLQAQKTALSQAATNADVAKGQAEVALAMKKVNLKLIKDRIENAPAELAKPCGECGKPHTADELAEFVAHQKALLTAEVENIKPFIADLSFKTAQLNTAIAANEAFVLPDVTATNKRISELNSVIRDREAIKNKIILKKKDHDTCLANAKAVLEQLNPFTEALQASKRHVEEVLKQIQDIKDANKALEDDYALRKDVTRVFGPAGVRARILDTVTPFLNERTASYLNALSDGNISAVWSTLGTTAKGDLREKFNIAVESSTGGDSFGLLSGGEKRKVRLATALALQDLVASRASKPISLWIGDEIDDALDPAGLERLMTILEARARDRGTVLMISHNELSDWSDQSVTITKQGGVSTIEGVLKA